MNTIHRLRWLLLFLLTSLFVCPGSLAQEQQKTPLRQYIHKIWTNKDGLPHNSGRALVQTQDGYLWIATQDGLVRFNGSVFQVFDKDNTPALKHNDITALIESADGTLWIGTYNGLTSFKNGIFTYHPTNMAGGLEIIRALAIDHEGNCWIGTMNAGLLKYKDGKTESITTAQGLSSNVVYAIAEDHQGNIWIGTNAGVSVYRHGRWSYYTSKNGLPHETVRSIYEASDSTMWIGTSGGLVRWRKGSLHTFTTDDGLSNNRIRTIYEDRSRELWIGTEGGGICQFDHGVFTPFRSSDGLSGDVVVSILEDREGTLWVGNYNTGLDQFWKGKFLNYTVHEGLPDVGTGSIMQAHNGEMWIGCAGVVRFDGKKFMVCNIKNILPSNNVRSFFEDSHGTIWIGTEIGLTEFRNGIFHAYTAKDGLTDVYIRAIGEDHQGYLWVGTLNGGIHRLENGRFVNYRDKGLPMNVIRSILVDYSGAMWVGGNEAVMRWQNGSVTTYTQKDGLPVEPIYGMMEDREHTLWMGSYGGGLVRVKDGKFTRFTRKHGLYNDAVYEILEDDLGYLWMSHINGISRVSKQILNDFADGKIDRIQHTAYTYSDGMLNDVCSSNGQSTACKTSDGRLWFSTAGGIVVVDPKQLQKSNLPPPIVIERVVMDRVDYSPYEYGHFMPGYGQVEFHYGGLSFTTPQKVNFRYKLEGFDKEWRSVGTRNEAFYTNLPPGEYVFRVTACNSDGVWNETGASFAFELKPHFYQTLWFYGLMLVAMIGIGFGIYRWRMQQFVKREKQLEQHVLERRAVEEALAEERNLFRILIDHIPDGIYVKDTDCRITIANITDFHNMGAQSEAEVLGKTNFDFFPKDIATDFHNEDQSVIQTNKPLINKEEFFLDKEGKKHWMLTSKLPLRDEQGKIVGLVGISRDITEQKKLQQELLQSQKMQSIGTLAGGIAHDFNNILGIMLGYTSLLSKQRSDDQKFTESLSAVTQTIQRGAALVRQILTFARKTEISFEPIDVTELVHEILSMLKQTFSKLIIFTETFDKNIPYISADRIQIHQALLNLCVNARDAMPDGGTISIKVEKHLKDYVRTQFSSADQDSYVSIDVSDTGEGMDEATRQRIFDPFFTTKPSGKGTGMGLSVVYGVMQAHQGFVSVESKPGNGTTFHLYFPISTLGDKIMDVQTSDKSFSVGGTETILFVEDEELLRDTVCPFLESKGYTVHMAKDGLEGIDRYSQHKQEIALVITDLGLPGISGMEEFKRLKEINSNVKVIFASGFFDPNVKSELLKAGAHGFIQKPYMIDEILQIIRKVLDESS